jgi:hypothetical protein
MNTETFECEDSYEAEKLSGLLAVQKDNSIYVTRIVGAVQNEIIIMLKDKSSHSVTLKDEKNALRLRLLVEDIVKGGKKISECVCENRSSQVRISTQ